MDKIKLAFTFIGIGIVVGVVIALVLVFVFDAKPTKVNVGPIEFEMSTPTTEPEHIDKSASTILFEDDFEDGTPDGWAVIAGKWEVVQDTTGNYVYKGTGDSWGYTVAGSDEWENYAVEVRVKGVENLRGANDYYIGLDARVNWGATPSCERYASHFGSWANVGKYGPDCSEDWPGRPHRMIPDTWYLLRLEVVEDAIRYYVDNELVREYKDSELRRGYIGLAVSTNAIAYFDDVRVMALQQ